MFKKLALALSCSFFCISIQALTVGEQLPPLAISDLGEAAIIGEDEVVFSSWDSQSMQGKMHVLTYQGARKDLDKIHKPFLDALQNVALEEGSVVVVNMVNSDDAMWGASALVVGAIKKTKLKSPQANLIIDAKGKASEQWGFKKKKAYMVLLDNNGKVLIVQESAMTEKEILAGIEMIKGAP